MGHFPLSKLIFVLCLLALPCVETNGMENPDIIEDGQISVGGSQLPGDQTLRPSGKTPGKIFWHFTHTFSKRVSHIQMGV